MTAHSQRLLRQFSRRSFLMTGTGLAIALIVQIPFRASAQATAAGLPVFMRLSALLTARDDLPEVQGRMAFEALSARFPDFGAGLSQLAAFVNERGVDASGLQPVLDEAGAEFAWVPRQIVSAWYLGVVGAVDPAPDAEAGLTPPEAVEGTPPIRGIAWERALMFAPLAGIIPIPSYVTEGSWAERPENGG